MTTLAEQADGKPLNGPNDMVVHPNDKAIWFTDPGYGAISIYEGKLANTGSLQPHQKEAVYRIDPQSGQVAKVADEPFKPNGIAFSHDYKKLYVCDTGITHYPQRQERGVVVRHRRRRSCRTRRRLIDMTLDGKSGFPDGLRVDTEGNIWVGAGWVGPGYDGVQVFAPMTARASGRSAAGDLRQRLLRRQEAQPPVHDREPVALCGRMWRRRARIIVERRRHSGSARRAGPEFEVPGFDASHRPGTTGLNYPVFLNPAEMPLIVS